MLGSILIIIKDIIVGVFTVFINLIIWFLSSLLPTLITYIGMPMFILGVIVALGLTGGSVLFFIIAAFGLYYFIKNAVFKSDPAVFKKEQNNTGYTSANMAIFKS